MRKQRPVLILVLVSALLAACGGSSGETSSPGASSSQRGYLAQGSDGAAFLQWTRSGGSATGTLTLARVDPSDPYRVATDTASFTAVIEGSSVTLRFDQGLGFTTNWNGSIDGDKLTLAYALEDGTLAALDFEPATAADYNAVVQALQESVAQAQAEKDAQENLAAREQAIDDASSTVQADIEDLQRAVETAQSELAAVSDAIQKEEESLATAYGDLQTALKAGAADVCYAATDVEYAATDVDYAATDVAYALDAVASDIEAVNGSVGQLQADFDQLRADLGALPDYRPPGLPAESDVSEASDTATTAIAEIKQTMTAYRKQARQIVQTAKGYAAQAQVACGG